MGTWKGPAGSNKLGRRPLFYDRYVSFNIDAETLVRVDKWRLRNNLTRSETMRTFIEWALEAEEK